jgi:hypothetical protein
MAPVPWAAASGPEPDVALCVVSAHGSDCAVVPAEVVMRAAVPGAPTEPFPHVLDPNLIPGLDGGEQRPQAVLASIEYKDTNFQGQFFHVLVPFPGCAPLLPMPHVDLPEEWRNVISSSDGGYSGCDRSIHYDGLGGAGMGISCTPDCAEMGEMDDRTESIYYDDA